MTSKKILINLEGEGKSESYLDNVLIEDGITYIMDNHRLALWCWAQKLDVNKKYNLFHIDAHPDLSTSGVDKFKGNIFNISLDDYRNLIQEDINIPLIRWDNYIEIFLKYYPHMIAHTVSATHHVGSNRVLDEDVKPYDLLKRIDAIMSDKAFINEYKWIMNLDLDYLYSSSPEKVLLFSDTWLRLLNESIQKGIKNGLIEVFTISLSPECCGGWDKARDVLKYFYQSDLN